MSPIRVVYDAAVLVEASAHADPDDYAAWPDLPPVGPYPAQDCIGILATSLRHGGDVQVVLSRAVLAEVQKLLADELGLEQQDIDDYLLALLELAAQAGLGPVPDPPSPGEVLIDGHRGDVLRLALGPHGGGLVVTTDPALLALADAWRQRHVRILHAEEFALRVDAARRGHRRS